jgi:tetraacyldisaccharide 4'-kinase
LPPDKYGKLKTANWITSWGHAAFRSLQEEPGGPAPSLGLRAGAAGLAALYSLGARGRRALYDRGWQQARRLPGLVLSLGNLTVGGVGKTPLTALLAERYQAAGCRVAVLSRGYGGRAPGVNVISDGRRVFLKPPQAGDEAYLLAQKLPGIPVITGPDRYQAGLRAWEAFQPDLFLLDDGLQHFQLHRDLEVVLLDAARPFGNGRLLPRGPLREPVSTLQRAQVLVLTRYEPGRHESTWEAVREAFPAATVVRAAFRLTQARAYPGCREVSLEELGAKSLAAMAGLARPEVLAANLRELGLDLKHFFQFPDHQVLAPDELTGVVAAARRLGAKGLVTTEKDWMRLAGTWNFDLPLYVVHLGVKLLDPWPAHLLPLECAQELRTP